MVRVLTDHNGRREYAVSQDDLDFFGEVMGRVMRPQLPTPTAPMIQALPDPILLPSPPAQHLLMPALTELPEPHPALMPGYAPVTQGMATFEPVRIKRPTPLQIALALAIKNKRLLAIGGLSCAIAVFLLFAGSFLVRKIAPEPTVEVGPAEAIGDGEVKGESIPEEAPPAEPPAEEKPAAQFPAFPAIPR